MYTDLFHYHLPDHLIAHAPSPHRDRSRLLTLDRRSGQVADHIFRDISDLLDGNSILVLNNTKVFPARLHGHKQTGGQIETLLISQTSHDTYTAINRGKLSLGTRISYSSDFESEVIDIDNTGIATLRFNISGPDLLSAIYSHGQTPLPPYIHSTESEEKLRDVYQTVYADQVGSVAAPTAGLHFTSDLLDQTRSLGIPVYTVSLHVGLGTFRPVTEEQVSQGSLHQEQLEISQDTANAINAHKQMGKKIIAVGTTTTRTLESMIDQDGILQSGRQETDMFIKPGYKFQIVDGLITNFHLPKSSLLMLVSAFCSAPNTSDFFRDFAHTTVGQAYRHAIKSDYRFFSFGDAMYIY
jgi:S-adenosylmethionine:tRNA ribosyltransferase-isomerase